MDELRWILLFAGVLLIGGIYYFGRKRNPGEQSLLDAARDIAMPGRRRERQSERRAEETAPVDDISDQLDELSDLLGEAAAGRGRRDAPTPAHSPKRPPHARGIGRSAETGSREKIIALHVAAPSGDRFAGADLLRVFATRDYEFGEYDIYHSVHEGSTVFSIVNMVKPGWFEPDSMEAFTTPGISLFLQLPGPLSPTIAFEILLAEANLLARELGGVVQDASHSTLSQQTIQHLREEVQAFAHALRSDDE